MTIRWIARQLLISSSMIVLAVGLGACSSSYDGFAARAELAANSDDYCQNGGAALGMAALNGAQAAYSQCMQQRYTAGAAGFRSEDSYAPGQSTTLSAIGLQ